MEGLRQRYWEDVEVGASLPPIEVGPVSMTTIVKFAGASGDFAPIHHDVDVAQARELAGPIIMGPFKWAYMSQLVTNWMGLKGRLRLLDVRLKKTDLVGGSFLVQGTVVKKEAPEVECEVVWKDTETGEVSALARAVVWLPRRQA